MKQISKRLMAAALTGALLLPSVQAAEAGNKRGWHGNGHGHHHVHKKHRHHKHKKNNNNVGAAVAAGVIGLAAGAILLGATSRPSYAGPPPVRHYPPPPPAGYYPPVAPPPGPVYGPAHTRVGFEPWSPAWYRYCSNKFRSFDPQSGTYMTYRGVRKFCQ